MFNKLGLLAVFALFMSGCGGGGSVSVGVSTYDPYYDSYLGWVVYDPYGPYYDPYCYYCYSDDGGMSQKDLAKMTAQQQAEVVGRSAEKLQSTLGLSAERSLELAKLAVQMAKTPKASLTLADYDNFSKTILGSTAKDFQAAYAKDSAGDSAMLEQLIDRAASVNGIGPEHARKIMNMLN
ncbi:MAG: hypothetical protein V4760_19830 [Bdellovibrionota bacterium]